MTPLSISMLTICGISELPDDGPRSATHVLSILDPEHPDPDAFQAYESHHRTVLRFHDIIEPRPGMILPETQHIEAVRTDLLQVVGGGSIAARAKSGARAGE